MKAIGDYIHARGLRYGIYASIGTSTCTGRTAGSLDHETRDVATFASWGVDYIKADRCNASGLVMKDLFARWRDAIVASGRPILAILTDPEVIAVDQDPLAFQAIKAADDGSGHQVWYKPLDLPGGRAVGLLNRGNAAASIAVDWNVIGLAPGNATVRDLWARV